MELDLILGILYVPFAGNEWRVRFQIRLRSFQEAFLSSRNTIGAVRLLGCRLLSGHTLSRAKVPERRVQAPQLELKELSGKP
jgi:hypothetical protein